MTPRRLLVLGRECETIARLVAEGAPEVEVAAKTLDAATPADLERAEMVLGFRIPAPLGKHARHLAWVQSTGAGVDGILRHVELAPTTLLTRVVGVFGPIMSDYVVARCLAIAQELDCMAAAQRERAWEVRYLRMLSELRIVVLGLGEIGAEIVRRLAANGALVEGVSRSGRMVPGLVAAHPISQLREVLPRADVLVVVLPDTAETFHLLGARELALLPRGAHLVNVARGSLVDEPALAAALESGHLGGAWLDVFEVEPLPESSPLWSLPGARITPHISGLTRPEQAAGAWLENHRRLASGRPLLGLVDRARGY